MKKDMQEENKVEVANTVSLNRWLQVIAITVAVFAAAIAIYMYLFIYGGWGMIASVFAPEGEGEEIENVFVMPDLDGEIFISATTDVGEGLTNFVPMIVLPETSQFAYLPIDQLTSGLTLSLQHNFSENLAKLTFLGLPQSQEYLHETPSIYRADTGRGADANYDDLILTIQNTAALALEPDEVDYFRQGPVISPSGDIIYASLSEADFDPEPSVHGTVEANTWTIYKLDNNNQRVALTNGLSPKWIDGTKFAFLKNDGIYLYNTSTSEEMLLWGLDFVPTLVNAFDVSDDGTMLAVSNPSADIVTVVKNSGWEGDTPVDTEISEVIGRFSGLTFASDNSYLAMFQLVATNETGTEGHARLTYYALEAGAFHEKYVDLADPQLQGIYMNDWK